jgi:hypothetical protein
MPLHSVEDYQQKNCSEKIYIQMQQQPLDFQLQ